MITVINKPKDQRVGQQKYPPQLENGDHLTAREFLRRYEGMPELKKAELVGGIVYLGSSVPIEHGESDGLIQGWLGTYSIATSGVKQATRGTVRLGPDDVLQPDGFLRIVPEAGGQARIDENGFLLGPPELVTEVAASSVSIDTREKLTAYRRAGVREYIVWRTQEKAIDWLCLEEDEYVPLATDSDGTMKSRVFPGLWLDVTAVLSGNGAAVLSRLENGINSAEHAAFVESLKSRMKI